MRRVAAVLALGLLSCGAAAAKDYRPLPGSPGFASVLPEGAVAKPVRVAAFRMRETPVTNGEFLEFVRRHPEWRRDRVAAVFADSDYLSHWSAADSLGAEAGRDQPVTRVSWFAAAAFCEAEGARLPTWYEWERAAAADATRADARSDPAWRDRVLEWYARPSGTRLPDVGGAPDVHGLRDLNGLVWEWVDDFNALLVSGDSRDQDGADKARFCGAGALALQEKENFATLMRVAMLASLQARDTTRNLGFRCAKPARGA